MKPKRLIPRKQMSSRHYICVSETQCVDEFWDARWKAFVTITESCGNAGQSPFLNGRFLGRFTRELRYVGTRNARVATAGFDLPSEALWCLDAEHHQPTIITRRSWKATPAARYIRSKAFGGASRV
jgi:hypothetical protein